MIEVYLGGVQVLPSDPLNVADESFFVDSTVRSRGKAQLTLTHRSNASSPAAGQEVKIYSHGGGLRFGGYIDQAPRRVDEINQRHHQITARDYSSLADLRSAGERTYINVKLFDIIRDLVTDSLATDGVGLTNVPANTGPVIDKLELDYPTVAEAFNAACRATNYEWEIDGNKEMRAYQPTAGASLGTINSTTVGIRNGSVSGREDLRDYANKIVVILSRVLTDEQTESFGGSHPTQPTNGTRTDWEMAYRVHAAPAITVNGTAKTVGLDGVDTGKDWYWQAGSAVIRQDAGGTVLTSSDTLEVVYIGEQSQQVFAQDNTEIAVRAAIENRSGVYEKIIRSSTPVAAVDAQGFADRMLAQLKQVAYELEFEAFGATYAPGQKWTAAFSGHPTGDYIITRVQWEAINGSYDSAASSPMEKQRVTMSKGVIVRDIYESWKEAFSGGGSASVSGGGSAGGGSTPTISPWHVITYASTITPSGTNGANQQVTLTGDITINAPTGFTDGQELRLLIIQDSTPRTITFNAAYRVAADFTSGVLASQHCLVQVSFGSGGTIKTLIGASIT